MQITFKWPWESNAAKVPTPITPVRTATTLITQENHMSFSSILQAIGKDAKSVFSWVGSAKGQAVIGAGEAAIEGVAPALTGIINLANTYITEAVKTEALAAAAGTQNGTGVQKLAAVTSAVTPQVLAYAVAAGLPAPTASQISAAANGIVAFLNAFEATA